MNVDERGPVDRPGARVFVARVTARRRPLTDRNLLAAGLRYPLMTAQVIALIHLEAMKLRWLGVPYRRPPPDHRPLAKEPPPRPCDPKRTSTNLRKPNS
jgi:DUF1365 family protein